MTFKPPRVDTHKTYVMKHVDRDAFVSQMTPLLDSPHVGNARRFSGKWLNDETCWRWWIYYFPVEVGEAIKLYSKPDLKRVRRKVPVTEQQHKKNEHVRRQITREFKPLKTIKSHEPKRTKPSKARCKARR